MVFSQSGTVWLSQPLAKPAYVCRMLSALCVCLWTCLNRKMLLTNGVTKNQPTLFQQAWKTHIKEVREEEKRQDRWRIWETEQRFICLKDKNERRVNIYFGKILRRQLDNIMQKTTKHNEVRKYKDGQKYRIRAKKRSKEKEWIKDWKKEQKQKKQKTGETGGYI